jgi:hypothetical protein
VLGTRRLGCWDLSREEKLLSRGLRSQDCVTRTHTDVCHMHVLIFSPSSGETLLRERLPPSPAPCPACTEAVCEGIDFEDPPQLSSLLTNIQLPRLNDRSFRTASSVGLQANLPPDRRVVCTQIHSGRRGQVSAMRPRAVVHQGGAEWYDACHAAGEPLLPGPRKSRVPPGRHAGGFRPPAKLDGTHDALDHPTQKASRDVLSCASLQ